MMHVYKIELHWGERGHIWHENAYSAADAHFQALTRFRAALMPIGMGPGTDWPDPFRIVRVDPSDSHREGCSMVDAAQSLRDSLSTGGFKVIK